MQPKFNKLITLLLLLGTFAFLMEAEQRIKSFAKANLSGWASVLPHPQSLNASSSINPYAEKTPLIPVSLLDSIEETSSKNN